MLIKLISLLKLNILAVIITVLCLIVLSLGCVGIISWSSPVELIAEEVLEKETGLEIKPAN